ncbi:D-glycerate dehydrogenase [Candidatus Parcubacteria bacterium]|nr:MAG: D-glycerate dehydrogenase [Candidatus Parcubacteria bacterium]
MDKQKVIITRPIPEAGIKMLRENGFEVIVSKHDRPIEREELLSAVKGSNAILSILTDKIDEEVFSAAGPNLKIVANYAVGYDNIDLSAAKKHNVAVTNTPDVLTETVAEHTFALILAIAHRVAEGDRFTRAGKYHGWGPMMLLGNDVSRKTLGVVGLGRIGSRVAYHAVNGFGMKVLYYDIKRNEAFEKESGAAFREKAEDVLKEGDFISIHVPLLETTRHLVNKDKFKLMKKGAYLINTSRGPVVDEAALAWALKNGIIRGAALDVFEEEPKVHPDLVGLENVILTPHIASATEETRGKMSEVAAVNIIAALEGKIPPNRISI